MLKEYSSKPRWICDLTHFLMDSSLKISKAVDEPEIYATTYRWTIGFLRYLLHTRSDLYFSVGVHSSRESHRKAVKYVLMYIKCTTEYGIFFRRNGLMEHTGYSDNSHNIDVDDGRSTSGHIFYLGSSLITWTSQKQPTVVLIFVWSWVNGCYRGCKTSNMVKGVNGGDHE